MSRGVPLASSAADTRGIGLLPSRARLDIYAKFAISFAKLSRMQTPKYKTIGYLFFMIFGKLQECKVQIQNL